jgi:hypothetical protein
VCPSVFDNRVRREATLLGEDDSRLIDSLMLDCARGTGAIGLPGKQAETWRECAPR